MILMRMRGTGCRRRQPVQQAPPTLIRRGLDQRVIEPSVEVAEASAPVPLRIPRVSWKLNPLPTIQEPTTMPWGNRSLLFRDPDGNLVNFFTPVTPEAIKKFKK
jgi:hypothetical protein